MQKNQSNKIIFITLSLILMGPIVLNVLNNIRFSESDYQIDEIEYLTRPKTSYDSGAFLSAWNTSRTQVDSSNAYQIRLPLESKGTYDFFVKWGDGTNDSITAWDQFAVTHTYASRGVYTLNITGTIKGWSFNGQGDKAKILNITQWGDLQLGNSGGYFQGCYFLKLYPSDVLNLTGTTNLHRAFFQCDEIITCSGMNSWDVSNVTDMSEMFFDAFNFIQPIGNWNVSKVTDMSFMFYRTFWFNQPIGDWNVSSVTNMQSMFHSSVRFNQPIGNWDVSNVTDMSSMFNYAYDFDQDIGNWNVSRVTDMNHMFYTTRFNPAISDWDVSSVTDMSSMFDFCRYFDQPLESWNVSNVTDMSNMFGSCFAFDHPLGTWDVSNVITMAGMFRDCTSFDQPLGSWNVSNIRTMNNMFFAANMFNNPLDNWNVSQVLNMERMFHNAFYFNQPLNSWDVSNVVDMTMMFYGASSFNQALGSWDVSNVEDMENMFYGCLNFDQPLGSWDVSNVNNMNWMFREVTLSTENYDDLLIGWSQLNLQMGVTFDAGNSKYSRDAVDARNTLVYTYGWVISDGGLDTAGSSGLKITLIVVSIILFLGGGSVVIYVIVNKTKRTAEHTEDETQFYEQHEGTRQEYVSIQPKNYPKLPEDHADVNMYYLEKFEEQKKILTEENHELVREKLIDLLQEMRDHNQADFINEKLHQDMTFFLRELSEKFEDRE